MELSKKQWKEFDFIDVFTIKGGFYNKKPISQENGEIPFIGATGVNNGITEYYSYKNIESTSKTGHGENEDIEKKIYKGNCICVVNNGSAIGNSYYQKASFTCSHDVNILYLKNYQLNQYIAYFLISCIKKQGVCFIYSRKWRPSRMIKSKLLLPVNENDEPDYVFMEQYIFEKHKKKQDTYLTNYAKDRIKNISYSEVEDILKKEWQEFYIVDIFPQIQRGKRLTKVRQFSGVVPYVSSSALSNGVDNFIGNMKDVRRFANCLSLANSGSVGSCFYEPYEFVASDHITMLKGNYSRYVYLFLATMLRRLSEKYNFNREINDERLKREKILLPINLDGQPDFAYMEQYTKNIMKKKYEEYLAYSRDC